MSSQLTEHQRRRLADILQREPPHEFLDPGFNDAYDEVQRADPELALAWLDSLGASEEEPKARVPIGPLPAEEGALRARWAAMRRKAVRAVTTSRVPEGDSPQAYIPDSRRIVATAMFGAMALAVGIIAWAVYSSDPQPASAATPPQDPPAAVSEPPVIVIDPPVTPAPEPEPEVVTPAPSPMTFTSEVPQPVMPAPVASTGGMPPAPSAPEVEPPRATTVYYETSAATRSTMLHHTDDLGTGGMVGGNADTPGHALVSTPPTTSIVHGTSTAPVVPAGGVVYATSGDSAAAPAGGVIFTDPDASPQAAGTTVVHTSGTSASNDSGTSASEDTPSAPLSAPPASAEMPTSAAPSSAVPPATLAEPSGPPGFALALGGDAQDARTAAPSGGVGGSGVSTAMGAQAQGALPAELQVGARVPARLVTSATIVAGAPAPVIAETYGQWCGRSDCPMFTFIGQAELVGGNRVVMNFAQVVAESGVFALDAVALSEERSTSIPAVIRDETPALAPDLVRASLGGVTDWASALANQQRTTFVNGNVVQESVVPPIEALIAGSLAQALQLPNTSMTVVRLAELDPGTPVVLAIGLRY